jgi:hypothetical protein
VKSLPLFALIKNSTSSIPFSEILYILFPFFKLYLFSSAEKTGSMLVLNSADSSPTSLK